MPNSYGDLDAWGRGTPFTDASHMMVFRQIAPGDDTRGRWEMHCSCGAWQHGTRAEVEWTAEMHQRRREAMPDA